MNQMEFRILGPLEIEADGTPVELVGQRQRALLIALLLRANEVVPTDRLVDDLWGEAAPKTATTSLHNAVSQLRRILGGALVTRSPGYVLRIERSQVDAFRFEELLATARTYEPAARAAALHEALALWRGSALVDVTYESFAAQAASRLEELRVVAREELAEAELSLGKHDSLVPELEALVSEHPLRERVWGLLMLALYRTGRQADALQVYQDARRTLLDELASSPAPPSASCTARSSGRRSTFRPAAAAAPPGSTSSATSWLGCSAGASCRYSVRTATRSPRNSRSASATPGTTRRSCRGCHSTRPRCAATARCTTSRTR